MQIDESRKLLLSDTLVPDIFITEHMPALSGLAVKLYLYLLLTARTGRQVSEADLARRLGADDRHNQGSYPGTCPIRPARHQGQRRSRSRTSRPRKSSGPIVRQDRFDTTGERCAQEKFSFSIREKLMADIAKTFFQGLMSPSWYGEIDSWFDRFRFRTGGHLCPVPGMRPPQQAGQQGLYRQGRRKLGSARHRDLPGSQQLLPVLRQGQQSVSKKSARKLRKTMTEYDEEIVARWIEQYRLRLRYHRAGLAQDHQADPIPTSSSSTGSSRNGSATS